MALLTKDDLIFVKYILFYFSSYHSYQAAGQLPNVLLDVKQVFSSLRVKLPCLPLAFLPMTNPSSMFSNSLSSLIASPPVQEYFLLLKRIGVHFYQSSDGNSVVLMGFIAFFCSTKPDHFNSFFFLLTNAYKFSQKR